MTDLREQAAKLLASFANKCGACNSPCQPIDEGCLICGEAFWREREFRGDVADLERLLRAIAES